MAEKHLKKFDEQYRDNAHEGAGAENVGCIIMDVNTGEILAMASSPTYNLNDTRNTDALMGMPVLNEENKKTGEYINEQNIGAIKEDNEAFYRQLNALWKNFCINDSYEPGSVAKPFTVAAGIESGSITGNESYNCQGFRNIGGHEISCHTTYGDGVLTVAEGVERSCNVNMMYIAEATGIETFTKFQHIFNMGLKTNIDLAGEARTASFVYTKDTMRATELATCSFGQGFNATMIQMITGFCSLINGGYYYEPHIVSKIISPSGATVQNIEPRLLKQTISETTSAKVREMCNLVVSGARGTGKTARPAGYLIGGKTGTAETLPRGNQEYVVSFLGYAPIDDPQIAIYVVVDRPNIEDQANAKLAALLGRSILMEVLPYMNIFMTEELTEAERKELEELELENTIQYEEPPGTGDPEGGEPGDDPGSAGSAGGSDPGAGDGTAAQPWMNYPIDPESGYRVDPDTGRRYDAENGIPIDGGESVPNTAVPVNPNL